MANSFLTSYRQDFANLGVADDRPDWMVMRDDLIPLAQQNPALLDQYPDFAKEYREIREANAPSLVGEFGRAAKAGTQSLFSDIDAAAALGLNAVGADKGRDYMLGRAKMLQDSAAESAPTIPTTADIAPGETGASRVFSKDTVRYLAAKAGGAIPSLAEIAGLSAAGAALGTAVEPGVGTLAGAGEGALEGILDSGIIKKAIRALVEKGAARGLTEEGVTSAIMAGDEGLASIVTHEAKAIAAGRTGEAAALALGAYPLSAGGIYKETGRADLAAGLGAIGALAGAAPVIGLPARVVRSLFPRLTGEAATNAANDLVGQKASELMARLGRAGIAVGAGAAGTVGMEAANIVAKNITQGKDALQLDSADWARLREAAVGGALASAPFAAMAARLPEIAVPSLSREQKSSSSEVPSTPIASPEAPPVVPTGRTQAEIYRTVAKMAPDQQSARLAELTAKPQRAADEDAELELLRAFAPTSDPTAAASQQPPIVEQSITPPVLGNAETAAPPVAAPVETQSIQQPTQAQPAPAVFAHIQDFGAGYPKLEMYNLTEDIPGHPKNSTISRQTLENEGFTVPPAPEAVVNNTPIAFKDAGYENADAFQKDYTERHVSDAGETENEFLMRIYCSAQT